MLVFAIAHLSVVALRFREPDAQRAFRVPLSINFRGGSVPLPAVLGGVVALAGWLSVLILHEGARYVGGAWLLFGIVLYVVYRRGQDKPLRARFTIPAAALQDAPEAEYGSILVPVFGNELDDDIVGTAGRLAAGGGRRGRGRRRDRGAVRGRGADVAAARRARARRADRRARRRRCGGRRRWARSTRAWWWRPRWCARGRWARRSCPRPSGAAWRRSCSPPRRRPGSAAARCSGGRGRAARQVGRGGHPLRGGEGALPGDPHRAAGERQRPRRRDRRGAGTRSLRGGA